MKQEVDPGKAKPRSTGICQSFRRSDSLAGRTGWKALAGRNEKIFFPVLQEGEGDRTSISSI